MKSLRLVILTIVYLVFVQNYAHGQMINGKDTLYGNEWINTGKDYYKFPIAADGLYRITYETLFNSGFPVQNVEAAYFQIFYLGKEIAIYTSQSGIFKTGDFIEFTGNRIKGEIDRFLYDNGEKQMLNPDYSLFNDTINYYITWDNKLSENRIILFENDITNPPPVEESFNSTILNSFTSVRNKPLNFIDEYNSRFEEGEGYGGPVNKSFTTQFALPALSLLKDSAEIDIRLYTLSGLHKIECKLNENVIGKIESEKEGIITSVFKFPATDLLASNTITLNETDPGSGGFIISNLSYHYLRTFDPPYPGLFNLELDEKTGTRYLELNGFNNGSSESILIDQKENIRMIGIQDGSLTKFNVINSTGTRNIMIIKNNQVESIKILEKLTFRDFKGINADYIIISNQRLYDDNGTNYVEEYTKYRQSEKGGNHKVISIEIQELYDQFAYGNNRNVIGIRNFTHYIKKNWPGANSIFLIGKGREYPDIRAGLSLLNPDNKSFYIPTFGSPGSDNLLVTTQAQKTPFLSIGRIAAQDANDIKVYLEKIKLFESQSFSKQSIADQLWKKEVIHLGGGNTKLLQDALKNLLSGMQTVISSSAFGAHVNAYFKTSSDPIQQSQNDQIFKRINNGVSIISFLGHSAVGTFDFSIDNPQNYNNYGKYPLMFSLGCYSGNYNSSTRGVGESFCFYKDKGALGFIATSYVGIPSILAEFTSEFYNQLGGKSYGKSVGEILKNTYAELNKNPEEYYQLITEQMSFHGDPAYTINASNGPDYITDLSSIKLTPGTINVQLDSFLLEFDVFNLGKNIQDSLTIAIDQKLPNGLIINLKRLVIIAPSFTSHIQVFVKNLKKEATGKNLLFITLDPENEIVEQPVPEAKNNNKLNQIINEAYEFFVTDNLAIPVWPLEFSIVRNPDIILKASTLDPFANDQQYFFELDTSTAYNSSLHVAYNYKSKGGIITWKPGVNWQDSTTYFWRIRPDTTQAQSGPQWQSSSFFYRKDSHNGWSQGHIDQYAKDELINLKIQSGSSKLSFVDDVKDIFIQNYIRKSGIYPAYYLNNTLSEISYGNDITSGVYIAVIDPKTGIPWVNPKGGIYGSQTPASWRDRKAFPYNTTDPTQREKLINLLRDTIPDNYYVIFFTIQDESKDYQPQDWAIDSINLGTNVFQILEKNGAKLIRNTINNAVPYSLVYQKGKSTLAETIAISKNDLANLNVGIKGSWDRGYLTTGLIGPAKEWHSLVWDLQAENGDSASIEIYGIKPDLKTSKLISIVQPGLKADLSVIDPHEFPYLQLKINFKDSINKTVPALRYVRVYYEGAPDFVISPDVNFQFYRDTLERGDLLHVSVPVYNISTVNSDSLLVKCTLRSKNQSDVPYFLKIAPLKSNSFSLINYQKETKALSGEYTLEIEVNPDHAQLEQVHFNNYAVLNFFVQEDIRNPLLDVTFDGVHIINGDIVSAKPVINMELKDENNFLKLSDTSSINLLIKFPDATAYVSIPSTSSEIKVFPATGTGKLNKMSMTYTPKHLADGAYELLVQAMDASGNTSGKLDYKIHFKIVNKSNISNFLPYPNPFSTGTQFVYTLTGDHTPEHIRIRIFSISGILVKEVSEQDLGTLKIGTHRTDYTWNGTDTYGNRLANGVYLYQVIIKDNQGKEWENYQNTSDKYFDQGFGKLVILR